MTLIDTTYQMAETSAAIFRADEVYRVAKRVVALAQSDHTHHIEQEGICLYWNIKSMVDEGITLNDAEIDWLSFLYYLTLENLQ